MTNRTLALALGGCLSILGSQVFAQGTDLHIVAPSAPGTGWDQVAQTLRSAIAETGGLTVAVTNVPGKSGLLGLSQFLTERGDTDLLVTGLTMLDATLLSRSSADFTRLTPIARLSSDYFAIAVPTNSALKSLQDLVARPSGETGKLTWGGGPEGGVEHVAGLLLAQALGLAPEQLNYVPFLSGAEARAAATEEKVGAVMLALSELEADAAAGRLRILGVSSPKRLDGLDVPTLIEAGVQLEFANWRGVAARAGLARDQQIRLAASLYGATLSPSWQQMLEARRWKSAFLGPEPFQTFVRQEHQRIKEALKRVGLLKRNRE